MNLLPDIPVLRGSLVRLEPLSASHSQDPGRFSAADGINAEAKLLLLEHAFETLGVVRVDRTRQERRASCATRRCSRWPPPSGRPPRPPCAAVWPRQATATPRPDEPLRERAARLAGQR